MFKMVPEIYDELWHYTSFKGAYGIISTGSVWATDATYVNDATEIKHFFDVRMFELALPVIYDLAQEKASNPAGESQMKAAGGIEKFGRQFGSDTDSPGAVQHRLVSGTHVLDGKDVLGEINADGDNGHDFPLPQAE